MAYGATYITTNPQPRQTFLYSHWLGCLQPDVFGCGRVCTNQPNFSRPDLDLVFQDVPELEAELEAISVFVVSYEGLYSDVGEVFGHLY